MAIILYIYTADNMETEKGILFGLLYIYFKYKSGEKNEEDKKNNETKFTSIFSLNKS